jgi:hypothetical protein
VEIVFSSDGAEIEWQTASAALSVSLGTGTGKRSGWTAGDEAQLHQYNGHIVPPSAFG